MNAQPLALPGSCDFTCSSSRSDLMSSDVLARLPQLSRISVPSTLVFPICYVLSRSSRAPCPPKKKKETWLHRDFVDWRSTQSHHEEHDRRILFKERPTAGHHGQQKRRVSEVMSDHQSYPCKTATSEETQRSLHKFLEPERKRKVIYTDNSLEFGKACEDLSWNHCTSTPHRSETNEIAERAVRRVKEGTSAVLLQSGLNENWWADSMECYTYLRNVTDLLSDGKTPYERRFGQPFKGPISRRDFLGDSEGSLPPPVQDSLPDAGEAINDFWSMSGNFIYFHHEKNHSLFH